jgi:hypothetical protein
MPPNFRAEFEILLATKIQSSTSSFASEISWFRQEQHLNSLFISLIGDVSKKIISISSVSISSAINSMNTGEESYYLLITSFLLFPLDINKISNSNITIEK